MKNLVKQKFQLIALAIIMVFSFTAFSVVTGVVHPPKAYAVAECSAQVGNETERCEVKQDCVDTNNSGALSSSNCGITRWIINFINILSGLVGVAVVGVLVVGGIQYSTSAGDPNAAAAAKKRITNAIVALVAFGSMYAFLQWLVPGGVL